MYGSIEYGSPSGNKSSVIFYLKAAAVLLVSVLIICSCATKQSGCRKNDETGNPGMSVNTQFDEYSPIIYDNYLYFMSNRPNNKNVDMLYRAKMQPDGFDRAEVDSYLPLNQYYNISYPSIFSNSADDVTELFFNIVVLVDKNKISQLYYSKMIDNEWTKPKALDSEINTKYFDSQPSISPDGKILVFVSDRPGGTGETDLYYSARTKKGWEPPKNLGTQINTQKSESTPFIAPDGSLYFSSNGFSDNRGFDIMKAEKSTDGWSNPTPLPEPFNTQYDETSPFVWGDKLIITSNRKGGCGGRDIYLFRGCGPVIVEGSIDDNESGTPLTGIVEYIGEEGNSVKKINVGESGYFRFPVEVNKDYQLIYRNSCLPGFTAEQKLTAPCSDTSTIKFVLKFLLPKKENLFTNEQYNVPFFVSGYYMPNTTENLNSLRLKFEYNLVGNSPATKYIEKPGEEYDMYAEKVDEALADAASFIVERLISANQGCKNDKYIIQINIDGYADSRPFSDAALYDGADIDDDDFSLKVEQGAKMNNDLLSELRAYYTAKQLQALLENFEEYDDIKDKIIWQTQGRGVDDSADLGDELKRRVSIKIQFKNAVEDSSKNQEE
ncbi:MAG: hypothetical protein QG635_2447 [Bacteroidota bacterium]|nr:hypothetical protein [Bacteroidota bacterium]